MPALALLLLLATEPSAPPMAAANQLQVPVLAGTGFTKAAEAKKNCVGNAVRIPAGMTGINGTVTSKFSVAADGAVGDFEVLTEVSREMRLVMEKAVRFCRFTPGRDPQGNAVATWMILPVRFAADPDPSADRPPRMLQEVEPGCIENQLHFRFPPNRLLRGQLRLGVAVTAAGKAVAFQLPPELDVDVKDALQLSIQACDYRPALDGEGRPVDERFAYAITFAQPGEAERAAAASLHKREAGLAGTTCLQRIRPFMGIGHVVVQVKVTAEGVPTDFRLKPDNVSAEHRLHVFDVLSTCTWVPALGLDDRPVAADAVVTLRYR